MRQVIVFMVYLLLEQINLITLVLLMIWIDEGPSIKALAGYQKKMEGCCHLMKMYSNGKSEVTSNII
ncbi:hypothetical protein GOG12_004469 [Salmonella enterica]|nr:hypothetical protein [Salmonella enterica subsp. enterica serovar Schwarzengrund]